MPLLFLPAPLPCRLHHTLLNRTHDIFCIPGLCRLAHCAAALRARAFLHLFCALRTHAHTALQHAHHAATPRNTYHTARCRAPRMARHLLLLYALPCLPARTLCCHAPRARCRASYGCIYMSSPPRDIWMGSCLRSYLSGSLYTSTSRIEGSRCRTRGGPHCFCCCGNTRCLHLYLPAHLRTAPTLLARTLLRCTWSWADARACVRRLLPRLRAACLHLPPAACRLLPASPVAYINVGATPPAATLLAATCCNSNRNRGASPPRNASLNAPYISLCGRVANACSSSQRAAVPFA